MVMVIFLKLHALLPATPSRKVKKAYGVCSLQVLVQQPLVRRGGCMDEGLKLKWYAY